MNDIEHPQPSRATLVAQGFGPCDAERLAHRRADLLHRAALVTEFGWEQFRHQWSSGEVTGTALVLHDRNELIRCGETVASVLSRWAFDLWGIRGGREDADAGCPATRAWFDTARRQLTNHYEQE
ncbi:hypothetical protein [Mycobacteroides abscessus]|uniref:hypothetical protein n=1 Tax=Mycobacteroides abscessus TaxID=36809 RepID=UPI00092BE30A|nr:hypothetical protein [Mycobacteroides abscessus]SIC06179.1 Uncharacterised protein [Mycobacteroides abscessus subsp. bolletii]SKS56354.1 Uncharacterised protein [Mycobacteroides abscessus subsp. bolletii]